MVAFFLSAILYDSECRELQCDCPYLQLLHALCTGVDVLCSLSKTWNAARTRKDEMCGAYERTIECSQSSATMLMYFYTFPNVCMVENRLLNTEMHFYLSTYST